MPARSVGIGVKPGGTGALGALGNRYGSKAMKAGLGRYSGAQLGHGGYRSLGLGGRAGLKQGGYATPGAYGASLGTGMPLGTGLTNGLGLGLGQGAKRAYGAGVGALPGYGALAGIGYPGPRPGTGLGYRTGQKAKEQKPGVSTANLGGPEIASLGQTAQDLKREKSSQSYGHRAVGLEIPNTGRSNVLGPEAGHREAKSLDPMLKASSLGPLTPLDKQRKILAQGGESYDPTLLERRGSVNHGSTLAARGVRPQLPLIQANVRTQGLSQVQHPGEYDSLIHQQRPKCGSSRDLSGVLGINHHELLGAEAQRTPGLVPRPHAGKESKHLGHALQQAQGERNYQPLLPQTQDVKSGVYALSQGQASRSILSAVADGQAVRDLGPSAKETKGPRTHGAIAVENLSPGSLSVHVQGARSLGPVSTRGTQNAGIPSLGRQEGEGVTVDGQEQKPISHTEHDVIKPKALNIPGEAGRSDQATSYIGGAGNYLGAGLGPGGYGAGVGQGAYLGATGKLGGYGEGVTGHLGALAGNGYGYGNGYSDGYGAALSTGGYTGQVQGAYGALGTGLDSTGGKYGGAAQVPYASAPVIPTGLEGDGGYPYPAQPLALGAEGAKTANKLVAAAGYGAQQTGFGAQLGATQDALAGQPGKFGGVDGALDSGYKDLSFVFIGWTNLRLR
ncbi:spidroin-1 isoform X2 [Cheilinus undulatus]|uniref:spidroin-1 isoform X2 n=1 Tax=Cheilinus undulatus TaxID=241271 RepID=UPI001BD42284|nr:spidroin-1 isoform X2 [Cheilinus undulatus]